MPTPIYHGLIGEVLNRYKGWVCGQYVTAWIQSNIQELLQVIVDQSSPVFLATTRDEKNLDSWLKVCGEVLHLYKLLASEPW